MLSFFNTRALADASAVLAWMKGEITREAMLTRIASEEADLLPHDAEVHYAEAIMQAASLYRTLLPKEPTSVVETDASLYEARPWISLDLAVERERDDSDDWADPVRVEDVTWDDALVEGRRFVAQAVGRAKAVKAAHDRIVKQKVTELFARGLSNTRAAADPEGWMLWANGQAVIAAHNWSRPILETLREEVRWAQALIGPEVVAENMPLVGEKWLATYRAEVASLDTDDEQKSKADQYIIGRCEMEYSVTQALSREAWYEAKVQERRRELHYALAKWFGTDKYEDKHLVMDWTQSPNGKFVPGERLTPKQLVDLRTAKFEGDYLKGLASTLQTINAKNRRRDEQAEKAKRSAAARKGWQTRNSRSIAC